MSFTRAILPGERLHLQHGPIDLIIGCEGDRARGFDAACAAFDGVLERLVEELDLLRMDGWGASPPPGSVAGPVAQRMVRAVARHKGFVTPMAAVAGSVADHVLAGMCMRADLRRAYVNNGGDIALWLEAGERFRVAMAGTDGQIGIGGGDGIGGIATSGRGGRSLSLGIADAVTVLAADAAAADVAATLIANAVDLPGHAAIRRAPASEVRPESDLGARDVVVEVGALDREEVAQALTRGAALADAMRDKGVIRGAALALRGEMRIVGAERFVEAREAADA
ncbi:MAG: hypothetical protein HLUCCO07_12945 [Rhodobacteraceae bacterium HLUCCO07]|nr:MAG: hypothetical protein HLUCCO07_12945 [Rhodobacteraceae bacterium HLUCCO07]